LGERGERSRRYMKFKTDGERGQVIPFQRRRKTPLIVRWRKVTVWAKEHASPAKDWLA
jgi:hypothetical protein